MTKRLSKKTKPAKRNPTDLTLRNLRAMNKRLKSLECELAALDATMYLFDKRLETLEKLKAVCR